jgi:hypothetical protein
MGVVEVSVFYIANLSLCAIWLTYHCVLHCYPHQYGGGQDGERSSTASKMVFLPYPNAIIMNVGYALMTGDVTP